MRTFFVTCVPQIYENVCFRKMKDYVEGRMDEERKDFPTDDESSSSEDNGGEDEDDENEEDRDAFILRGYLSDISYDSD